MRSYTNSHSPRPVLIALSLLFAMLFGMEGSGMAFGKIGARKMMYEWKNPYVTKGLIAMWDAEWNVGGGKHESAPMLWKDLSGNGLDMISNGSPVFYDNYISPTQQSEMFHTEVTDLCDGILETAALSMEVVGLCVIGKNQPKFCLFGGSTLAEGFRVIAACGDPTRVGIDFRIGSVTGAKYASKQPFAKFSVYSDGETATGRYLSSSGELTRDVSVAPPITNYVSKRFAIGYRYSYYGDSPMTGGERVYSIRVYNRSLTAYERAQNDSADFRRFSI